MGIVPGVVGHHQGAALGGDVLGSPDLDPEPLLLERPGRGEHEALGDLGVEAVLVDLELAGQPSPQEGEQLGGPLLPPVPEDLSAGGADRLHPLAQRDAARGLPVADLGGVLVRSRASSAASSPASSTVLRRPSCGAPGRRPGAGRVRRARSSTTSRSGGPGSVGRGRAPARCRLRVFGGASVRAADDGLLLPLPRPGRPRVPSGMISASGTTASDVRRRRPACTRTGASRCRSRPGGTVRAKSAKASAVV